MFAHISIPIDHSAVEAGNLKKLVDFVKKDGAAVTLVHVSHPSPPVFYMGDGFEGEFITSDEHRKACESYASNLFQKAIALIGDGAKVDTQHVFDADVAHGVLKAAEGKKSDAIVMIPGKRHGLARLFHSSKTSEVIRESKIPLIIL